MLRTIILALCLLTAMAISSATGHAQDITESAPGGDQVTIDTQSLDNLITTLESDSARQDFVENLKTLSDAQQQQEEDKPESLTAAIGLNDAINDLIASYQSFLTAHDLNSSLVGKGITTLATLLGALILGVINRKACVLLRDKMLRIRDHFQLGHSRFRLYARIIRYTGYVLIGFLTIYSLGIIWDVTTFAFVKSDLSVYILGNFVSLVFITATAIVIWETINGFIEHYLRRANASNFANYNRLRTLLPIIQHILFIVFAALFALVILSELGINILPLLAGAGILGIAVGFGAQTMVKDFLTGFVIILEDVVQVGDVAKIGGQLGVIEKITMRKIQLRDLSGIVYTVPYSEITTVENWTKDFSYYVMDIGVAYRENTDDVVDVLRAVDEDLRADESYGDLILDPIEILGVDKFADSAVIIKARIKTKPIQQWNVGREFNRRMKIAFDKHGIEIPFPHQTIYFGEDKQGKAPPAQIMVQQKAAPKKTTQKTAAKKAPAAKAAKKSTKKTTKKK